MLKIIENPDTHKLKSLTPSFQSPTELLYLLQLASAALPVGSYSYSEGLETLTEQGIIQNATTLKNWLEAALQYGSIRLEAAVMIRGYRAAILGDLNCLAHWNTWATAAKETEELRQQSWQMGRALTRLILELPSPNHSTQDQSGLQERVKVCGDGCNFAIAFGIAAAFWQISAEATLLGYFHSWATNLINAGVKLIPLGQTAGQRLLLELYATLSEAAAKVLELEDDDLVSCSWGLAFASMAHEIQYTRLFRS